MTCMSAIQNWVVVARECLVDVYDTSTDKHNIIELPGTTSQSKTYEEKDSIVDISLSPHGTLLAIMTGTSKRLIVYKMANLELFNIYLLPRSASKARFTPDSSQVLVADKTGDALMFNLKEEAQGTKLFGHLSLLLDILMTEDSNYIITSDRDEKIRVSHHPNTYNIKAYCLGHKEFVKHLEFLPHDKKYLLSGSGDGTVKVWDYADGRLCHTINTCGDVGNQDSLNLFIESMDKEGVEVNMLPIVHLSTTQLNSETSLVAVSMFNCKNILIYTLTLKDQQFDHKLKYNLILKHSPDSILFHNNNLLVFKDGTDSTVQVYEVSNDSNLCSLICVHNMFIGKAEPTVQKNNVDINLLYKRKFDNVQEYQERKRQRLEKHNES